MANRTNCQNCTSDKPRDREENVVFSSASYERHEARHERREKRLVGVIALLIVLLVASNVGWLIYESQFETIESTTEEKYDITQEAENGNNNSIINGGEIVNGETND